MHKLHFHKIQKFLQKNKWMLGMVGIVCNPNIQRQKWGAGGTASSSRPPGTTQQDQVFK